MALISGFPNFFTNPSTGPQAAQLNSAATLITQQVGGVVAGGGGSYPGQVDLTNLAPYPQFKNSQKAEPYSVFFTCSRGIMYQSTGAVAALFPPTVTSSIIYAVAISQLGTQICMPQGGSALVYQNGMPVQTVYYTNKPVFNAQSIYGRVNIPSSPGDIFIVDLTNTTWSSTTTVSPPLNTTVALVGVTVHTK